jgi:5-methylcytosine-specific restriction enzyme subunit McrC
MPKIHLAGITQEDCQKIFLKMLSCLRSSEYKDISNTNIDFRKFHIIEIFITLFLDQLDILFKKGLRKNYISISENCKFLKGRLKIQENIRENLCHKDNFYVEYSDFIENIPENRVIKTALKFLSTKSTYFENIKRIRKFLFILDEIDLALNIRGEFSKISINRNNNYYEKALNMSKIFLLGNSYVPQAGSNSLVSLSFPLNKLFEDYVLVQLEKDLKYQSIKINAQESRYYLMQSPSKFVIKPDIVLRKDNKIAILDTKWKLLNENSEDKKLRTSVALKLTELSSSLDRLSKLSSACCLSGKSGNEMQRPQEALDLTFRS